MGRQNRRQEGDAVEGRGTKTEPTPGAVGWLGALGTTVMGWGQARWSQADDLGVPNGLGTLSCVLCEG